jgi:hypothetical protein
MELSQVADIFKIVGGIIVVLNFGGVIFLYFVNKASFHKIMTNDLKHLDEKIDNIQTDMKLVKTNISELGQVVAYIRGQFDAQALFATPTPRRRQTVVTKRRTKKKETK